MPSATQARGVQNVRLTAAAAVAAGELRQLANGLAGAVAEAGASFPAGERVDYATGGSWVCPKKPSVVCLDGGSAYWDYTNGYVTPLKPQSGRGFFVGVFVGDADSADATCTVLLNVAPRYAADLRDGVWTTEATDGLGVTQLVGGGVQLAFDAVAEVAQAALYSERTVPVAANPILECRFTVADNGDNAALDLDVGLASGSHATDFESITEFVAFHLDGNTLDLDAHSDDGTTDVAPADTTVDLVEGTYVEVWIDARDPSSVKLYVDGVRVLSGTTFTLANATGPLKPIAHMEKTSDDTTADLRIDFLRVRTAEQ